MQVVKIDSFINKDFLKDIKMVQKKAGLVDKLIGSVFRVSESFELRRFRTALRKEEFLVNRMPHYRAMIESKRYDLGSLLPVAQEMLFDKYLQIVENSVSKCLKEPIMYKLETLHKNRDLVVDFDDRTRSLYNSMIQRLSRCVVSNESIVQFALYINHLEEQPNVDKTLFGEMKGNIVSTLNEESDKLIEEDRLGTLFRFSDICSAYGIFPEVMNHIVSRSGRVRRIIEEKIVEEKTSIHNSIVKEMKSVKKKSKDVKISARDGLSRLINSATNVLSKDDYYKLYVKLNSNLG